MFFLCFKTFVEKMIRLFLVEKLVLRSTRVKSKKFPIVFLVIEKNTKKNKVKTVFGQNHKWLFIVYNSNTKNRRWETDIFTK